jgi:hypothetical protein
MDARAEQLVLDYLRDLEAAAYRKLRPEERQGFLARSRASIARRIGESRADDAGDVARLLRRFGDPRKLAAQERRRLDAGARAEPGQSPGVAAQARRPSAAPTVRRPMTARWRPGGGLAAEPRPDAPVLRLLSRWSAVPRRAPATGQPAIGRPGAGPADGSRPDDTRSGESGWWLPRNIGRDPDEYDWGPADGGGEAVGAGRPPPSAGGLVADSGDRLGPPGGGPRAGPDAGRDWLDGAFEVLRSHPLECVVIALVGVGGLIDPFPCWLIGSLAVLVSRVWDTTDKLIAVAAPLAIAVVGAIALAGLNAHSLTLAGYAHGVRTDGWDLIRAGAVLGAAYLAWRVRQGPRPRRSPPWVRGPRG